MTALGLVRRALAMARRRSGLATSPTRRVKTQGTRPSSPRRGALKLTHVGKEAVEAQAKEREQTELAEQRLYDVRMNLVQRYWEDYDGELLQQGLDEQLPANQGGIDRRGFEWFYWQRKMSSGHITLKGHTGSVYERGVQPRRQAARLRQQ